MCKLHTSHLTKKMISFTVSLCQGLWHPNFSFKTYVKIDNLSVRAMYVKIILRREFGLPGVKHMSTKETLDSSPECLRSWEWRHQHYFHFKEKTLLVFHIRYLHLIAESAIIMFIKRASRICDTVATSLNTTSLVNQSQYTLWKNVNVPTGIKPVLHKKDSYL